MNRHHERRPGKDERGITLVELLVTAAITAVFLPLVFGVIISAQRQTASTASTADTVDGVRLAVATMARQVRLGSGPLAFSNGSGTSAPASGFGFATVYDQDGSPRTAAQCAQYRIKDGTLQTRWFTTQPSAEQGWSVVIAAAGGITTTNPFFPVANAPAAVRVLLGARQGSGRPVVIDSSVTARNTAGAAIGCGTFS